MPLQLVSIIRGLYEYNFYENYCEEDALLMGKLFLVAKKIAKEQGFAEQGYRTVFNCNEDGGQTVNHIHLHLLAGRSLTWPPG